MQEVLKRRSAAAAAEQKIALMERNERIARQTRSLLERRLGEALGVVDEQRAQSSILIEQNRTLTEQLQSARARIVELEKSEPESSDGGKAPGRLADG